MLMANQNQVVLYLVLRLILGVLFFYQGYDKVFRMRVSGVINYFRDETAGRRIPDFILVTSAWFTSLAELICGALLIVGFFESWSLYLLAADLVIVCAAFSILKPMWDMQLIFPRLMILAALLAMPKEWDVMSIDNFFRNQTP
jgi:uncharacterized membrane protein YphA (DoxX/SURF4 family)